MALNGLGAAGWVNGYTYGPIFLAVGFAVLFFMLFGWFGTVAGESERGDYGRNVDASFRWSMTQSRSCSSRTAISRSPWRAVATAGASGLRRTWRARAVAGFRAVAEDCAIS